MAGTSAKRMNYDQLVDKGYVFMKPGKLYHVHGPQKADGTRDKLGIWGMKKEALDAARKHFSENRLGEESNEKAA